MTPVLGAPIPRLEGRDKVVGAARYAADTAGQDEALTAWIVQAPVARGRIVSIGVDEVLAMPGVVAVLTHENAPRLREGGPPELQVLQTPAIRYRGEPVALVVAETLETARAAAAALRVDVEQEDAHWLLSPDSPALFAPDGVNGGLPADTVAGDVDTALTAAEVVVEAEYRTPAEVNHPLEPHSAVAWHDDGGRLELVEATQGPSLAAQTLRTLLGMQPDGLRLRSEHVGGGFGAKGSPKPDLPLAAMAAITTGRRVKLMYHRRMLPTVGGYRSPTVSRVRLGADRDGTLVAIDHEAFAQTGTFGVFAEQTADITRHLYAAPNRRTSHRLEPLDVPIPRFMRAPGEAPGSFALESAMDELATALGMDPIELRVRNEPDEDPTEHVPFSTRSLVGCLRRGSERFGWRPHTGPRRRRDGRFAVGEGVAASAYPARVQPSSARAVAFPDGTFEAAIAAADIGTGSRTVLTQVAADALGVPMERVRVRIADSTLPFAAIGAGSFGTESWGWAVHKACAHLAERLVAGARIPPDGLVATADTSDDVAKLRELSRHAYGAQFAEVRVDLDSGEVLVDRMLGVFAAGRILNARTAHSQLIGGMTWGIGMALTEAAEIDPVFGDVANADFATYHVAACADVRSLEAEWLDEPGEDLTPLGGKGIGEIGIVGAAAAIANAVHDATGVRVRELPIRPDSLVGRLPNRF